MTKEKKKVAILGAGPGGYRAAFMAADKNMDVTLIDPRENPGGVCLFSGCSPTKALLHLAKIKNDAAHAHEMGISFSDPKVDVEKIRKWKSDVVKKLTGGLGQLSKSRGIKYIQGTGKIKKTNTLEIKTLDGNSSEHQFDNLIIATGAKPVSVPNINIDNKNIINSTKALELEDLPSKILIIGGGYIGLEMATIYKALGSHVSLVEISDELLPGAGKDLVREYKKASKGTIDELYLSTKVEKLATKGQPIAAKLDKPNGTETKNYDKVLVAVGHKPNTENIGLDEIGVKLDKSGFIKVDRQQKTSIDNIYAIGDVAGGPMLAHKASYEGMVAIDVIQGKNTVNDAKVIPAVIYTDPEIATCGTTEEEAKEKNIPYRALKFPWSASGRAIAMDEKNGFTKLIVNTKDDRVIGGAFVGKNAGDMIPEIAFAIEMAANAEDIALTIHPHPSLSETIMEAAELYYGSATHVKKTKDK